MHKSKVLSEEELIEVLQGYEEELEYRGRNCWSEEGSSRWRISYTI